MFPTMEKLSMKVIRNGTWQIESVTFPARAWKISTTTWHDTATYWAANCAVKSTTNGQNYQASSKASVSGLTPLTGPVAKLLDDSNSIEPANVTPSLPLQGGGDALKAYILPNSNVGVVHIHILMT